MNTVYKGETLDEYIGSAELYDHVGPYRTRGDVQFYVDMARKTGGNVLEIGCGTGRVLIPTAEAGFNITGLDSSPSMLDICRQKLAALPSNVHKRVWLEEGDMRNFSLDEQYDLITIPFRPFQHLLTVEDQIACLMSVKRHLRLGGKFVFDLFNPSIPGLADETKLAHAMIEPEIAMPDGRRFVRSHKFANKDFLNQINDIEITHDVVNADGTTTQVLFAFKMRYCFRFEIEHLLVRCGFNVDEIFADFEGTPYGEKYPGDLVIVASRT